MDDLPAEANDRARGADASIEDLVNLGPRSARVLRSVGIETVGDLQAVGCVAAYVRAKHVWEGASRNLLWGRVAGLRGVHWTQLDPAEKAELIAQVEAFRLGLSDGRVSPGGPPPRG